MKRKFYNKRRSFSFFTLHVNHASVGVDDLTCDPEPETNPFVVFGGI